jgi:hypothetical protein
VSSPLPIAFPIFANDKENNACKDAFAATLRFGVLFLVCGLVPVGCRKRMDNPQGFSGRCANDLAKKSYHYEKLPLKTYESEFAT